MIRKCQLLWIFSLFSVQVGCNVFESHPYLFNEKSKVITIGGAGELGNALFRAAAAIAFAIDNKCAFEINNKYKNCYPDLFRKFNTRKNMSTLREVFLYYGQDINKKVLPNSIVNGYPHSYLYFDRYREMIKDIFAPSQKVLSYLNSKYGKILSNKQKVVGIHFRTFVRAVGGDKLMLSRMNRSHFNMPLDYYKEAIALFPDDVIFVVFSDNIKVAKKICQRLSNAKSRDFIFIEGESLSKEMYLMTQLENFILSNSTFAWWGCYLGSNDKKIVTPWPWYNKKDNPFIGSNGEHLICPPSWIEIPVKKQDLEMHDLVRSFL